MDLGLPQPPYQVIILGGVVLLTLLTAQLLIGYRKIHFKGRTHLKVHKIVAWTIVGTALLHAFSALLYLGVIG